MMEECGNRKPNNKNDNKTDTSFDTTKKWKTNMPKYHIPRYDGGMWRYETQR